MRAQIKFVTKIIHSPFDLHISTIMPILQYSSTTQLQCFRVLFHFERAQTENKSGSIVVLLVVVEKDKMLMVIKTK